MIKISDITHIVYISFGCKSGCQ